MITKFKIFESALFAPNGKTSNLNDTQYKLVRTDEFKNWFGDWLYDKKNSSKIVDSNGEPMVVYHGTPFGKFNEFKSRDGIFFSESEEFARDYAEDKSFASEMDAEVTMYPVFLRLKNLFEISENIDWLKSWLPETIEIGLFGYTCSKEKFINMLQGNFEIEPYWSKDKIDKAVFGQVIGEARDGFNNDIFIGIDKDDNVVYVPHHVYDTINLINDIDKEKLLNGESITVKGYKYGGKLYTSEELSEMTKNGKITDIERIGAISYNRINQKITPYKKTQKIQYMKDGDTWQLYELNNVDLFDKIKNKGYDGMRLSERGKKNIVVFDPKNIKLADGTNTTFDKNSIDIKK